MARQRTRLAPEEIGEGVEKEKGMGDAPRWRSSCRGRVQLAMLGGSCCVGGVVQVVVEGAVMGAGKRRPCCKGIVGLDVCGIGRGWLMREEMQDKSGGMGMLCGLSHRAAGGCRRGWGVGEDGLASRWSFMEEEG